MVSSSTLTSFEFLILYSKRMFWRLVIFLRFEYFEGLLSWRQSQSWIPNLKFCIVSVKWKQTELVLLKFESQGLGWYYWQNASLTKFAKLKQILLFSSVVKVIFLLQNYHSLLNFIHVWEARTCNFIVFFVDCLEALFHFYILLKNYSSIELVEVPHELFLHLFLVIRDEVDQFA